MLQLDPEDEHLRAICGKHSEGYWFLQVNGKQELLHRHLMNAPAGITVDHENNDRDDNRKSKLRLASYSENNINCAKKNFAVPTSSKYKGVYKDQTPYRKKSWWAHIKVDGKRKSLGYYLTETEAAVAYNEAAKKYHGQFAWLNPI